MYCNHFPCPNHFSLFKRFPISQLFLPIPTISPIPTLAPFPKYVLIFPLAIKLERSHACTVPISPAPTISPFLSVSPFLNHFFQSRLFPPSQLLPHFPSTVCPNFSRSYKTAASQDPFGGCWNLTQDCCSVYSESQMS